MQRPKRLKINKDVFNWTFSCCTKKKYKEPTLSFEELKKIEETEMPFDYLDNARDWVSYKVGYSAGTSI